MSKESDQLYSELKAAWERYARLKRKADRTLVLEDGLAARRAWIDFQNVGDEQSQIARVHGGNVAVFPAHKMRRPHAAG
ncbi:hypothetical protein [Neorhizobium petrolearium]|uniref:hypothetical protein n=1 Tax=Neorhizobium petrolearium TaxID=515361 RepID=UPI003F136873